MFLDYQPNNLIHQRLPLHEIISTFDEETGIVTTTFVPVDEDRREEANQIPWFFVVQVAKTEST